MQVFGREWFELHQGNLLRFANTGFGRKVLRIDKDVRPEKTIVQIMPNSYTVLDDIQKDHIVLTTDFRTRDKFARRLFYAFKPVWFGMHYADLMIPGSLEPAYGFGFNTLTAYPAAGENSPCDGYVQRFTGYTGLESFATIRAGAGTAYDNTSEAAAAGLQCDANSNTYAALYRMMFLFDTSSLYVASSISAAVLSLNGHAQIDNIPLAAAHSALSIVSAAPTSTAALAAADYGNFGSTKFATDLAYTSFAIDSYNDISLNASGVAAISKTGITKLGARLAVDADGGTPAWAAANATTALYSHTADVAGTASDPKLVVTYSYPIGVNVSSTWKGITTPSFNVSGVWKNVTAAWVKAGGVWKVVF